MISSAAIIGAFPVQSLSEAHTQFTISAYCVLSIAALIPFVVVLSYHLHRIALRDKTLDSSNLWIVRFVSLVSVLGIAAALEMGIATGVIKTELSTNSWLWSEAVPEGAVPTASVVMFGGWMGVFISSVCIMRCWGVGLVLALLLLIRCDVMWCSRVLWCSVE